MPLFYFTLTLLWPRGRWNPVQTDCAGTVRLPPDPDRDKALAYVVSQQPVPSKYCEGAPEVLSFTLDPASEPGQEG